MIDTEVAPPSEPTLDEVASAGRTALYRLYNADAELLYIGISDEPIGRMQGHAHEKPWWPEVARKTVVWYQYREQADTAETIAIGLEQPKYNKAKRYVRLPEQQFPTIVAPRLRRVSKRPVAVPATPSPAPSPRPEPVAARYHPHWHALFDPGLPSEWPASLWCVNWYYGCTSEGLCYEDFMRGRHGGEGEAPGPLDFLRERALARKEECYSVTWEQPAADGTWTSGIRLSLPEPEQKAVNWEEQRRFLFALLRAGRCASVQVGRSAWAAGIAGWEEARVTSSILDGLTYGHLDAAMATACLEAQYREPALERSGWRWFSDQCEACGIRANSAPGASCSCPRNCGVAACKPPAQVQRPSRRTPAAPRATVDR